MAPAQKKTRAAPASRAAKPNPRSTPLDSKLMLLWLCYKNKQGTVNWKAVGKEYGISATAAQYRLYRLRDYMQSLPSPAKNAPDTGMPDEDSEPDVDTGTATKTKRSKKRKTAATYADAEDEPLDDNSISAKVKEEPQEDSENDNTSTLSDCDMAETSVKEETPEDTKKFFGIF